MYREYYGEVSIDVWKAIKTYNVSPSDYDDLLDKFGDDQKIIAKYIIANSHTANSIRQYNNPAFLNLN